MDFDNLPIYKTCWKCDMNSRCNVKDKFQRLPRSSGGLGLCKKLKGQEMKKDEKRRMD